jgi:hypothetical protein
LQKNRDFRNWLVSFVLCALAGPVPAQQPRTGQDIKTACGPIAMAFASTRKLVQGTESWRVYASKMYFSSARTEEEARQQGFSADIIVEGIPISAVWSDDQTKRTEARTKWKKFVDETESKKEFMSLDEVKSDPQIVEQYNKCVEIMARSSEALTCWFSDPIDKARATLNVVLQPSFDMARQKVESTSVSNGFLFPDDMSKLRLSNRKADRAKLVALEEAADQVARGQRLTKVPNGGQVTLGFKEPIRAGVFSFEIVRLDPQNTVSAGLRLANNMQCQARLAPAAILEIDVKLWPEARNWARETATLTFDNTTGCGSGAGNVPQQLCYGDPNGRIVKADPQPPVSANCGSYLVGVAQNQPSPNCLVATGRMKGCGWDALGFCKGRGWLQQNILATVNVPGGARPLPTAQMKDRRTNFVERVRYDYDQSLPADAVVDRWRFNAELTMKYGAVPITFNLSDDAPSAHGCVAKGSSPGEASGYVQIACELPSDATARLTAANKVASPDLNALPAAGYMAFREFGSAAEKAKIAADSAKSDGVKAGALDFPIAATAMRAHVARLPAPTPGTPPAVGVVQPQPSRIRLREVTP